MPKEKPVVFIPMYNEAHNVKSMLQQLKPLQEEGIIGTILLVDDGSKDESSRKAVEAAEELKIDIIVRQFSRNKGKAAAFYEAVRYFRKDYFKVKRFTNQRMLMLDCDIKGVEKGDVERMLVLLGHNKVTINPFGIDEGFKKKLVKNEANGKWEEIKEPVKVGMVVGTIEGHTQSNSGQRALLLSHLNGVLDNPRRKAELLRKPSLRRKGINFAEKRTGYGLEYYLNRLFMGVGVSSRFSDNGHYQESHNIPVVFIPTALRHLGATEQGFRKGRRPSDSKKVGAEINSLVGFYLRRENNYSNLWFRRQGREIPEEVKQRILALRTGKKIPPKQQLEFESIINHANRERIKRINEFNRRESGFKRPIPNHVVPKARTIFRQRN